MPAGRAPRVCERVHGTVRAAVGTADSISAGRGPAAGPGGLRAASWRRRAVNNPFSWRSRIYEAYLCVLDARGWLWHDNTWGMRVAGSFVRRLGRRHDRLAPRLHGQVFVELLAVDRAWQDAQL